MEAPYRILAPWFLCYEYLLSAGSTVNCESEINSPLLTDQTLSNVQTLDRCWSNYRCIVTNEFLERKKIHFYVARNDLPLGNFSNARSLDSQINVANPTCRLQQSPRDKPISFSRNKWHAVATVRLIRRCKHALKAPRRTDPGHANNAFNGPRKNGR